jgi:hypothetical protein
MCASYNGAFDGKVGIRVPDWGKNGTATRIPPNPIPTAIGIHICGGPAIALTLEMPCHCARFMSARRSPVGLAPVFAK